METKTISLAPIKESTADYERLEVAIRQHLRETIYLPMLAILGKRTAVLSNAKSALQSAISSGRIEFNRGSFTGKFNASISKELKELGAKWDRKTATWKLPQSELPHQLVQSIQASASRFRAKIADIDRMLAQKSPEGIADTLQVKKMFDSSLWKVDKEFQSTLSKITMAPKLTDAQRNKIADEWQLNMRKWIKDFSEAEIKQLRSDMKQTIFSGKRYEDAIKKIKESYGVTERKAKFLARQETSLLMAKFKETRYQAYGIDEYTWHSVVGSALHPVRPRHKELADLSKQGKIFRWDDPPITTAQGEPVRRNNPGEDYNCRCYARPVVRVRVEGARKK